MGEGGGCLPGAPAAVDAALARLWQDFAAHLPDGTRLLDVATGTGAVLRTMAAAATGLELVGVDYARLPATGRSDITLIGETAIETMPFPDAHFDGVTSQFGFEYGDRPRAVAEVARVTRPGARLQFIVHHADSPIVGQNRQRLRAIEACQTAKLVGMARDAVRAGARIADPLEAAARALAERFPGQTVVREIPAALARAVAERSSEMVAAIAAGMDREISILTQLANVAQDSGGIGRLAAALEPRFACAPPRPVEAGAEGAPIAWLVTGNRSR